jgi:hypothetical protein
MLSGWVLLHNLSTELDDLLLNSFDIFGPVQYHALGCLAYDLRYIIDEANEAHHYIDHALEFLLTSYNIKLSMYDTLARHPKFTCIGEEIKETIKDILTHESS